MADNGFKINKSVNLNPQSSAPSNPADGDMYYDSTAQSFAYYHNEAWAYVDSVGTVPSTLWLTSEHFTPEVVRNSVIKVTDGTVLSNLVGISSSFSAKKITVYNAGTATIVVQPEHTTENTANNRIRTPTGGNMNLVAGEVAVFMYDVASSRWLLVSISSAAGAQVIATTANPGLVTLHAVSASGIVLSDGDINAANGVVGLNANKAVTIAAPSAAVTAVTITANGTADALSLNGKLNLNSNKIYNVATPATGTDAATKDYVDLLTPSYAAVYHGNDVATITDTPLRLTCTAAVANQSRGDLEIKGTTAAWHLLASASKYGLYRVSGYLNFHITTVSDPAPTDLWIALQGASPLNGVSVLRRAANPFAVGEQFTIPIEGLHRFTTGTDTQFYFTVATNPGKEMIWAGVRWFYSVQWIGPV